MKDDGLDGEPMVEAGSESGTPNTSKEKESGELVLLLAVYVLAEIFEVGGEDCSKISVIK